MKDFLESLAGLAIVCISVGIFAGVAAQLIYFGFWLTGAAR